jgi:mannose/cellobiose epimerase-like protein (N-acyl-D-glucosamine 2-epimerase family)
VARFLGDGALEARALEVVQWAYEGGWDGPLVGGGVGAPAAEAAAPGALGTGAGAGSGGFIYFRDAGGFSPTQLEAHMKLWWPQAEAMVAYAKAFRVGGQARHLARFAQVAEWTYGHLVSGSGEWFGYADRSGAVTHRFKGGPYKGCFHVPRAVFLCEKELGLAIAALEAQGEK